MFQLLKTWIWRLLFKPCANCREPRPAKYHWDNGWGCDLCTEWAESDPYSCPEDGPHWAEDAHYSCGDKS